MQNLISFSEQDSCVVDSNLPLFPYEALSIETNEEPDNQTLSSVKNHALKKRFFAPAWWVEGLLLSLGNKEAWFDFLASKKVKDKFLVATGLNAKNITLMFAVWHEILLHSFSHQFGETTFSLPLNKYLLGTQKDISKICDNLKKTLISSYKISEMRSTKKDKSLKIFKTGSLNLIRHVEVESSSEGIFLLLEFTQSLKELYAPNCLNSFLTEKPDCSFVSINPAVIQSMGKQPSLKKILNYLFFEFSKSSLANLEMSWGSFHIENKHLSIFHKNILAHLSSLYDHGILGWDISAPTTKISDMKKFFFSIIEDVSIPVSYLTVFCWQLSEQAKEALELEKIITNRFFYMLSRNCEVNKLSSSLREKNIILNKKEKKLRIKKTPAQNDVIKINKIIDDLSLSDNDFIILLSEFYESLKPIQKKAFERERVSMAPHQFKEYITPILKRKNIRNV